MYISVHERLQSIPQFNDNVVPLLLKFAGATLEVKEIITRGFTEDEDYESDYLQYFVREYKGSEDSYALFRVVLVITGKGLLRDIFVEGFACECTTGGWCDTDYLPGRIKRSVENTLNKSLLREAPHTLEDEVFVLLSGYKFPDARYKEAPLLEKVGFLIRNSSLLDDYIARKRTIIGLCRFMNDIHHTELLSILALEAVKYRLFQLTADLLRIVLSEEDLIAEIWVNVGCIFCDNFKKPEVAVRFFEQASELKPELQQPKHNIPRAVQLMMKKNILRRDYKAGIKIAEKYENIVQNNSMGDVHGFWSLLGFCREGLGDFDGAEKEYKKALQLEPECSTSLTALERLNWGEVEERNNRFEQERFRLGRGGY